MNFLPLNSILASGYAAREENIRFKITVKPATIKLFKKYSKKGICFHTPVKLANVKCFGIK